jgi:hypothetical protein
MSWTILLPITTNDVAEAIVAVPSLVEHARDREATVIVLETDCLHSWFTETEPDYEDFELRRIHAAAERVASALRDHGVRVEVAWECVRTPRRPVDAETVRRHGADSVFLPHAHRRIALLEASRLRRLQREGIAVIQPARATPTRAPALR